MTLPAGKTHAEALERAVITRDILWKTHLPEDAILTQLESYCTRLLGGDRAAGAALATEAIWS